MGVCYVYFTTITRNRGKISTKKGGGLIIRHGRIICILRYMFCEGECMQRMCVCMRYVCRHHPSSVCMHHSVFACAGLCVWVSVCVQVFVCMHVYIHVGACHSA